MTLKEYIKKRNGVAIGHPKSLRNNLFRALGARNFSTFWNYWNPIFGYYLGTFIFKPLKKIFPAAIALLLTFIFCGMLHDLVTIIFRGKIAFFFTIWFSIMGLTVLITKFLKYNFSQKTWAIRALANLTILSSSFLLSIYLKKFIIFY